MENEDEMIRKSNFLANHRLAGGIMPGKMDDNINNIQKIRQAMLTEIFKEMDSDFSESISLAEFHEFLIKKFQSVKLPPPSEQQIQELYERFDTNNSGSIGKEEFIASYTNQETDCMQEVAKYNKMVQDKAEEINLLKHKLEEYKKTEKHQKGSEWMEDSFVKFKLIDARNIAQLSRNSNVVFFAAVGESSCQTKVLSPNEPIIINEIFTFENISSNCKVINLFIYTEANFREKNYEGYIGKLAFQLSDYQDQKESMPIWMKFEERDLHINKGEIRFTVQFIYSYVKIYDELIEAREKECKQYEDFLEGQEKLLAMLQTPFKFMHHDQHLKPNSKVIPIVGEFKNLVTSYLNPNVVKSKIDDQLRKSSFMPKKAVEPEQKLWILLLYCALSVLVSLERESFIDICISITLCVAAFTGTLQEMDQNLYYCVVGSITFDLIYYLMFAYDWIFRYKFNSSGIPTIGRYLILFICIVLTFFKGYLFCTLMKEKIDSADVETANQAHPGNPYLS